MLLPKNLISLHEVRLLFDSGTREIGAAAELAARHRVHQRLQLSTQIGKGVPFAKRIYERPTQKEIEEVDSKSDFFRWMQQRVVDDAFLGYVKQAGVSAHKLGCELYVVPDWFLGRRPGRHAGGLPWPILDPIYFTICAKKALQEAKAAATLLDNDELRDSMHASLLHTLEKAIDRRPLIEALLPLDGAVLAIEAHNMPKPETVVDLYLGRGVAQEQQQAEAVEEEEEEAARLIGRPRKQESALKSYLALWPEGRHGGLTWQAVCQKIEEVDGLSVHPRTMSKVLSEWHAMRVTKKG